ncbi:MAG: T9SS type A sorting domain-containing protein [Flavobacteriia bacterium]|nr:T9SS type A sorting domain-containing protein [Flavobacteriia bacterium]
MKKALLALFFATLSNLGIASHIQGGYILLHFDSIHMNQAYYTATTVLMRDQSGASLPQVISLDVSDSSGVTLDTLALTRDNQYMLPSLVTGFSFEVNSYSGTAILDLNKMYLFSYSLCCRPGGFSNVSGSNNFDFYIETWQSTKNTNSSAQLRNLPPLFWRKGTSWQRMVDGLDIDGDSIGYNLIQPHSASNTPIANDPPYSNATYPLGATYDYRGVMAWHDTAGVPALFMLGIRITAFDASGNVTGSVMYDFPMRVENPPPAVGLNPPGLQVNGQAYQGNILRFSTPTPDTIVFSTTSFAADLPILHFGNGMSASAWDTTLTQVGGNKYDLSVAWLPSASDTASVFPALLEYKYDQHFLLSYVYNISFGAYSNIGLADDVAAQITMYPNPTTGVINLEAASSITSSTVYDVTGRVVQQHNFEDISNTQTVDLSGLNGIFFLQLMLEDGGSVTRQIMVR